MKLPFVIKIILNIIFYVVYVFIFSLIFGLVLGFILNYLDKLGLTDTVATYIQIGLSVFVLFTTISFRKYFYIPLEKEENVEK